MDDRTALLLGWLEGEAERRRRPVLPPPQAKDLALRGWAQVGACSLGAALAAALFVCWLGTVRDRATRVAVSEELRRGYFLRSEGDPSRAALPPEWWKGGGAPARSNGGALGVFLCVTVFAIGLGTVIGAMFLLAACALYNKLAGGTGSPDSVPEPLFGKAMGITFVTALVNAAAGFVTGPLVGAGPAVIAQLLTLPLGLLVMAGMNCVLLPTTFARGLLVALCYLLVGLFVIVVLAVVFGGLCLVASPLR